MREGAGVEDHEGDSRGPCGLDLVHELMLGIALDGAQLVTQVRRKPRAALDDDIQRIGSVETGFPRPEQVQVGTVEEEETRHPIIVMFNKSGAI